LADQRLSVESVPESHLSIDGKSYGKTPKNNINVTPGNHLIHLKKPKGGEETEFQISIPAGKSYKCTYHFETGNMECAPADSSAKEVEQKGYLTLSSEPKCDVFVDGKGVGKTPLEKIKVSVGNHNIEFRTDGYDAVFKDVSVEEGQTIRVETSLSKQKSTPGTE
jgi:hypothetical protein